MRQALSSKSDSELSHFGNNRPNQDLRVTVLGLDTRFGKFLSQLMTDRDFTVIDVATFTGISRPTIYRHIEGKTKPSATDRELYAKAFGWNLHEFDAEWQKQPSWAEQHDRLGLIPVQKTSPTAVIKAIESIDDEAALLAIARALPADVLEQAVPAKQTPPGKSPSPLLLNHQVDALMKLTTVTEFEAWAKLVAGQLRKAKRGGEK